nr:MAG TPA: hypothetical protein [Caudoviricetes sp.]
MSKVTETINAYAQGGITLEECNRRLRELGHPILVDPDRPRLTPEMIADGWGLLDTGTGTLDPVQVRDDELVDCDCGEMPAFVCLRGDWYAVEGRRVLR